MLYPNDLEMQDSACREVTEFKVVNCSCINDIPTIRGGLHEIAELVIQFYIYSYK